LKDGAAADGKKPVAGAKPGDAGFVDPVNARLDRIENDRKTEAQRAEQARVQAHQKEVFDTKFMPKITDLCKQKGVPQEDVADYANRVASLINGNPADHQAHRARQLRRCATTFHSDPQRRSRKAEALDRSANRGEEQAEP
jgi:hypothetical protein